MSQEDHLPDFGDPPLIEAVLGLEFSPLVQWSIPHYGLLWNQVKERYPNFEVRPTLAPSPDGESGFMHGFELLITPTNVRCWFVSSQGNNVMQVQADRLVHNWRKQRPGDDYPRYPALREAFLQDWEALKMTCTEYGLGDPHPRLCEVTYVNHVPRGEGWDTPKEIPSVVPAWVGPSIGGLLPVSGALNLQYSLQSISGVLRVQLTNPNKELLQLSLTAQGSPATRSIDGVLDWYDKARALVVRSFADLTSEKMHQRWQRKDQVS